ncbi:uncharacterized protein METZ01_LOCUS232553, partial [marine metagenome]
VRPKTNLCLRPHQLTENKLHCALQVGDTHTLVDVQPLDLLEGGIVCGIGRVAPIHAPRHNNSYRGRLFLHHANLHA